MKKALLLIVVMVITICAISACGNKHEHKFTEWSTTKNATCTEDGIKTRYCECGEKQSDTVPSTGHNYEGGMCKNCGTSVGQAGCKHGNLDVLAAVAPTCTVNGLTDGIFCNDCNTTLKAQEKIPAIGHTEQVVEGVKETCTANGFTDGVICSACNETIKPQEAIPAKGHSVEIIKGYDATCETTGLTDGEKCATCGETLKHQSEISLKSHTYDDEYDGICNVCGFERDPECRHTNTETITGYPATCIKEGYEDGEKCTDCGEILTERKLIAALGHTPGSITRENEVNATCVSNGSYDEVVYCTVEGCKTEISREKKIIGFTGHTYSDEWQKDETYHYHLAICGCDAKSDVITHTFDSDGRCVVCSYESKVKLDTPVIKNVEYDRISWTAVDNATSYTVTVNGDYTYVTASLTASLANVSYNGSFISDAGYVSIVVCANGSGRYTSSDNSSVYEYYYVPEKSALSSDESKLYNYGIGYGYNLIENEEIDAEMISQNRIINIHKLLTLGEYYNPPITKGYFDSYRYSSVDELSSYFNGSVDINGGLKIPKIAKIKAHYKLSVNESSSRYSYNEVYLVQDSIVHKTYGIKDYSDADLKHCLTETFLEDLKLAESMSESQWLDYMYTKYGTHVILGVATGGTYTAQYVVSTNNQQIAQRVKQEFELSGGDIRLSDLVKLDLGIGVKMDSGYNWTHSETEAHFRIFWTGSNGGGSSTPDNIDAAISNFESGLNESNAISVRFTTDGAISIGSLISMIDASLGEKFEDYVLDKSDSEYKKLYSQYTKPSTLPVSVESVNGENVLYIDLSSYQNGGSLSDVYNVNLLNGVLTVYPNMMGHRVDRIFINGAFDEYNKNLIDKFSIKLAHTWNKNVTVEVNNLGVIAASENGLVDMSELDPRYEISVDYNGVNAVDSGDGRVQFHGSINEEKYNFILSLNSGENLDYTTLQISSTLRLPVVSKTNCSFTGWLDGNGNAVTDGQGYVKDGYSTSNIPTTLYAKCDPIIYRIDLDHQDAESFNGPDSIFIQHGVGAYYEYECLNPIFKADGTLNNKIEIPTRVGYTFGGYYATVSNNGTSSATGNVQYVDADGYINGDRISEDKDSRITVFALWVWNIHVVTLDNCGAEFAGTTSFNAIYQKGVFDINDPSKAIEAIVIPAKVGYVFNGYFTEPDGAGERVIWSDGTIIVENCKNYNSSVTLYADWTKVSIITLNNNSATTSGTKQFYVQNGVGAFDDEDCTVARSAIIKPSRTGYVFKGYFLGTTQYIDENGQILSDICSFTSAQTLIAKWEAITYTVSFYDHYGYLIRQMTCTYDQTYNVGSFSCDGFNFLGWDCSNGNYYDPGLNFKNLSNTSGAHISMNARMERARYTVYFDSNGATGGNMSSVVYSTNEYYTLPYNTFEKTGYRFAGWSYNGRTYQDGETVINITDEAEAYLRAVWEKLPDNSITFYRNGGSSIDTSNVCLPGDSKTITYTAGTSYTIQYKASKSGKTFAGWATSPNGTPIYQMGDTIGDVGTIELYAIFR